MSQITPLDIRDAVTWITSRWPASARDWSDWQSFAADYSSFSVGSLKEALHQWHRRGESRGPNTSQLSRLVAEVHSQRVDRGAETVDRECLGSHVWAEPLPTDALYDGGWVRTCVLCNEERPAPKCPHSHRGARGVCVYCLDGRPA